MYNSRSTASTAWLASRLEPRFVSLPNQPTYEQSSATQGQLVRFPDRSLSIVTEYLVDTKGEIAGGQAIFSIGHLEGSQCSVPDFASGLRITPNHRFTEEFLRHPGSKYPSDSDRPFPEDDRKFLRDRLWEVTKLVLECTHAPRSVKYAAQCFVEEHHATALTSKPLVDMYNRDYSYRSVSTEAAGGTVGDQLLWSAHLPMASRRVVWSSNLLNEPPMMNGRPIKYMVMATWERPNKRDWDTIQYDPSDTPGSYTCGFSEAPSAPPPGTPALTVDEGEPASPEEIAELLSPLWQNADHNPGIVEDDL
ncbi:hypothetical protein I302_105162 [Kwoniella bestiolae CBS 10118]|uniref:Uncharacterized protein n=1 Tax=Kwoniella bestiolae CBS 10118 TaxID=1296100 RepID=A0A1B9FSD1_9TREE|nr:hypothetical protein I302_08450 [Kwoniella bestiolae CBS 10118]OCF21673.1 hypothetical protein I302_08450 [Kwoniella bestiolae CBS 10118]